MNTYAEDLAWLYSLRTQGIRYELDRMAAALQASGSPQDSLRVIHVAGTNGKGSVCALLEASLREAGYKTGLYTSPHLHRFAERIRVAGDPVADEIIHQKIRDLRARYAEMPLTFFEATTLFAWQVFHDQKCDVVIAEVGLGGRLDATNIVNPELSVITEINLDHQNILGESLAQIAAEKAAIIKGGRPSVIGCTVSEAQSVAKERARDVGSETKVIGRDYGFNCTQSGVEIWTWRNKWPDMRLGLNGAHQWQNAAVAAASLDMLRDHGWKIAESAQRKGFSNVQWPARLEWLGHNPKLLLDAAHNESGCAALAQYLRSADLPSPRVLLFGAMRDKNVAAMLQQLKPFFEHRVYTTTQLERSADPHALAQILPGDVEPNLDAALERAQVMAGEQGSVVVAGSIFLVAAVRARLLHLKFDPLIAF